MIRRKRRGKKKKKKKKKKMTKKKKKKSRLLVESVDRASIITSTDRWPSDRRRGRRARAQGARTRAACSPSRLPSSSAGANALGSWELWRRYSGS